MAYEWFISYRRKSGGENQARQVAEILSKYVGEDKVFYDRESMREGNWREQINDALNSAEHFVLLINEASAAEDQSNNIGGYRYEIEYALKSEKLKNNRITIIAYDNESYKAVTKEFSDLSSAQKVTYYGEYAKNFEERLCDHFEFVYQKPSSAPTVIKNITIPENLVTRRDMLDKLNNEFNSHQCVVISGIGGSGKTSLAYLYAQEQNFNNIAWVIVNGKIEDVFVDKIAGLLFKTEGYADFSRIGDAKTKLDIIQSELAKIQGNNLLVFDINTNNEEIKKEIETKINNYLPSGSWKTLVLTRTVAENPKRFATIKMARMADVDAQKLFEDNWTRTKIVFSQDQLAQIVKELYYHPLLIEQTAIVFSKGYEKSAEEIISKIKDNSKVNNPRTKKILSGLAIEDKEQQEIYTYLINLCNIENLSPEGIDFLAVYVTWPEEPIDYEVISTLLPDTDETLDSLVEKGIISRNDDNYYNIFFPNRDFFSIHSLIADVIRIQINIKEFDYTSYFENIKKIFEDNGKLNTLHKYSTYLASSFVNISCDITEIINKVGIDTQSYKTAYLYYVMAVAKELEYKFFDAKKHFEKALEIMNNIKGNVEELKFTGELYKNLAALEDRLSDIDSSIIHYQKAVEIYNKISHTTQDWFKLAFILYDLSEVYEESGEGSDARYYFDEGLRICRSINRKELELWQVLLIYFKFGTLPYGETLPYSL